MALPHGCLVASPDAVHINRPRLSRQSTQKTAFSLYYTRTREGLSLDSTPAWHPGRSPAGPRQAGPPLAGVRLFLVFFPPAEGIQDARCPPLPPATGFCVSFERASC